MKAHERHATTSVILGRLAVGCLLVASLGLNLKQADDLKDVKKVLISRCETRQVSDLRTRDDLRGRIDLYAAIVATETHNAFIDDTFRARRIAPYRKAMTAAQAALDALPQPTNCARVYATGSDADRAEAWR